MRCCGRYRVGHTLFMPAIRCSLSLSRVIVLSGVTNFSFFITSTHPYVLGRTCTQYSVAQVERGPIDSFCYLAINIEYKEMTSWEELDIYVNFKHVT